jgi:hypothetical protein
MIRSLLYQELFLFQEFLILTSKVEHHRRQDWMPGRKVMLVALMHIGATKRGEYWVKLLSR